MSPLALGSQSCWQFEASHYIYDAQTKAYFNSARMENLNLVAQVCKVQKNYI